jgi:excisionase family DNA binding protein
MKHLTVYRAGRTYTSSNATEFVEGWIDELGLSGKAVLTIAETAEVLRVCERNVRESIRRGDIPHVAMGRRILVPVPQLVALLSGGDPGPHAA